jgi:predicted small lipoprotein YifL
MKLKKVFFRNLRKGLRRLSSHCNHKKEEVEMKNLLLAVLICAIAGFSIMGCGKKAGTEHPAGHEQSAEHSAEHPQ